MKKNISSILFYLGLFAVVILLVSYMSKGAVAEKLTYSQVIGYFEKSEVKSFVVDGKNNIELTLKSGDKKAFRLPSISLFITDAGDMINAQRKNGTLTSYDYSPPYETPFWISFIPYLLMIIFFGVIWFFMMNNMNGGSRAMSFGRSRAKKGIDEKNKKSFDDVAGADEEKLDLEEIVDFLKNPKKYTDIGARIPKGVLLVGPPGTGKTLLAKAVAGEAGVPFFSISGSDFVEMFVGVGASRVRDLFEQAKKNLPCIIFIDEIDAVGRHRGAGLGGGHDEREQTLNQLLVEMDGFSTNEGVIIIAATNRPDILDPALLRPGRFDREIVVNFPDIKGREAILKVHAKGKPFDPDVKLGEIAKSTAGFTGADLENLLNESALLAARRNAKVISMPDIESATMKVLMGTEKKSRIITDKEKKLTAYHEAGHALVGHFLETQDPVHEISIIPRGRAGGYTMHRPSEERYYATKMQLQEEIVSLLGGRASEKLVLGDISTGASNDIERATDLAKKMVTKYGMSDKIGPIMYGNPNEEVFLGRDFATTSSVSEYVASQIDTEQKRIIDECYEKACSMLTTHMDKLHAVASALLEKEKITGEQFVALMDSPNIPGTEMGI